MSTAVPPTPSVSGSATSSSASTSTSTSTFKAMSISYADRIRAGLSAPTSATSSPASPGTGSSAQAQTQGHRPQAGATASSSTSSAAGLSDRSANGSGVEGNSSGLPTVNGSNKSKNGSSGGSKNVSGSNAGIYKIKPGSNSSGQVPPPSGSTEQVSAEDEGSWQEVVSSHPRASRIPRERVDRDRHSGGGNAGGGASNVGGGGGKREYGSGHREERLANEAYAHTDRASQGVGQERTAQGSDRAWRRDREGLSLSRNTTTPSDGANGQTARPQGGGSDASATKVEVRAPTVVTSTSASPANANDHLSSNGYASSVSQHQTQPSVTPADSGIPPSPSLGTTLEDTSTAASVRSPQLSQSGTEDVHIVGNNGWETPSSVDSDPLVQSAKSVSASKPSLPQVNIWQVRRDRMSSAASSVTEVIATATTKAVAPGTATHGKFPPVGKTAGAQESRRTQSEGSKGPANVQVVRVEAGTKFGPSSSKLAERTDRRGAKGWSAGSSVPVLSDEKMWPDVQVAASNAVPKANTGAPLKKGHVEDSDGATSGLKKEKTKWKAISAAEMQAAIDAVKRVQQSEANKTRRAASAALNAQNGEGVGSEPSKAKTRLTSSDKLPKAEALGSPSAPTTKKAKPASVKGSPAMADKAQFDSKSSGKSTAIHHLGGADSIKEGETTGVSTAVGSPTLRTTETDVVSAVDQTIIAPTRNPSNVGTLQDPLAQGKEPEQRAASQAAQDRDSRNPSVPPRGGSAGLTRGGLANGHGETQHGHFHSALVNGHANGYPTRGRGSTRGSRGNRGSMRGAASNNGSRSGGDSFPAGHAVSHKNSTPSPMQSGTSLLATMHSAPIFQPSFGYVPLGSPDYGYYGYPTLPPAYYQPMGYPNAAFENPYGQAPAIAQPPPPLPVTDIPGLDISRIYILGQLEYYFSMQNLAMDFFLRQQMDSQGWIDLAMIASFNRIKNLTTDIALVLDVAKLSSILEVKHAKVRLAGGQFRQWVLPDAAPAAFNDGSVSSPSQSEMVLAATSDISEDARGRIEKDVSRDVLKSNGPTGETARGTATDAASSSSSATVVDNKADLSVASSGDLEHDGSLSGKEPDSKAGANEGQIGEEKSISL